MHKVYENDYLMMYVRKRYCHCCGAVLQRKTTERIVRKGDPEHTAYCSVGTNYKPYGDILVIGKEYSCPRCNRTFSCDQQGDVTQAQTYYKRKVVSDEEIAKLQKEQRKLETQRLLQCRWLLLVPVLGALICHFLIFNGKLSRQTGEKDGGKLFFANVMAFVGVAVLVKLILGFFADTEFLMNYQRTIMLIPSLFAVNIPTLWYINHTFR